MIACQDKRHPSALTQLRTHLRLATSRAYRVVGGGGWLGVELGGGGVSRWMAAFQQSMLQLNPGQLSQTLQGPQTDGVSPEGNMSELFSLRLPTQPPPSAAIFPWEFIPQSLWFRASLCSMEAAAV